ncbi:mannitol dehydrogenase [Sphingomonas sp. Leaf17]|uniref:mannitol dehydrogenase family protein n=1 Tax=Sphingomonas sp. Leaf17 TaxID=1735683 RepID=UPI0006FE73E2|nr:mannitol dehydrogenase family protein [Sphingomonas sp. Leaf17]KQM64967.1 mannitol dehydrogenase [Sphingomonas sp. Leaf17]
MIRLSHATLDRLPVDIATPRDRPAGGVGIVHFGPGAFHRAHQAAYIDQLLADDPRWGIAAVSLRTRGTVDALAAQDGLYTLAIRDAEPAMRVIGAHRAFLGPEDAARTLALLADPAVALVTTTVTEKGYCLAGDGTLDLAHPDIVHDLARSATPRSVVGWIVAGLAARKGAGTRPFTPMPCDNLASNGPKLKAALVAFARAGDPSLADWIDGEVRVPSTMVDSITPASDAGLEADVATTLGVIDRAPVQRETFTQWVIEDSGRPIGPDLGAAGATITDDVAGYEQAKLRILNGAHSTLAYAGLLRGATSVADAMRDADLADFVDAMIARDIIPMLAPVRGLDIQAYRAAVLQRFRNPVIVHRLDQIAQDGSQKLPYRLGDSLIANRRAGRMPTRIVAAFGAWVAFLIQRTHDGGPIVDPAADTLKVIAADGDAAAVVARLAERGLGIPRLAQDDATLLTALQRAAAAAQAGDWATIFAE